MSDQSKYRDKINQSKGVAVHWACTSYETSIEIHRKNSDVFLNYLTNPIPNPFFVFPTIESRNIKIKNDKEVTRLLHNYVASAKTLVERSRIFSNKHLPDSQIEKYNQKIKLLINDKPIIIFVQNLRNYLLHKGNPSIVDNVNSYQNITKIGLVPRRLLEWEKWDSSTKQ